MVAVVVPVMGGYVLWVVRWKSFIKMERTHINPTKLTLGPQREEEAARAWHAQAGFEPRDRLVGGEGQGLDAHVVVVAAAVGWYTYVCVFG